MSADSFQGTPLKEIRLQVMHHLIVLSGSERKLLFSETASISPADGLAAAAFSCCVFQLG